MGSPLRVETLSELESKILRDEVTLWVECGPRCLNQRVTGFNVYFKLSPTTITRIAVIQI